MGKYIIKNGGILKADPKPFFLKRRRRMNFLKKVSIFINIFRSERIKDIIIGVVIGLVVGYILHYTT